MAITLITGGARSGKSDYALSRAASFAGDNKYFLAACPPLDAELRDRIEKHRQERAGLGFITIEEEVELARVLAGLPPESLVLLDCLTIWISNLLFMAEQEGGTVSEEMIVRETGRLIEAARVKRLELICVSNEVGMGLVPVGSTSRLYRDLVGRCNRLMAEQAQRVILVSCGLPILLKGSL